MLADGHLQSTHIIVAFVVIAIFYGGAVAALADEPYLSLGAVLSLVVAVITFIEPIWGLYLFVASIFAEGLLNVGLGTTGTKLVGILVCGAWVLHALVIDRRFRIILPVQGWFAICFVMWGWLSALWALNAQLVFSHIPTLIQLIGLYILVVNLVNSPKKLRNILSIIVIASSMLALLTVFRLISGEVVAGRANVSDISGDDPNFLAAYLLPSAALLTTLFSRETQLSKKLFLLPVLLINLLGILATSSRGAIVALVVTLTFGPMLDRRMWQVILPAVLAVGAVPFFLPSIFLERIKSIVTLSDRGAGRLDIWLVGWRMFCTHPLLGVGLSNFRVAFERYLPDAIGVAPRLPFTRQDPHSIFLSVLSSLGAIGFVLFSIVVGFSVKNGLVAMLNLKRKGDFHLTTLATGIYLGLLGTLSAGMFIDLESRKYFWLLLALVEVMRRLSLAPARVDSS